MTTYRIIRYFKDIRPAIIIKKGISLEQAKEHCSRNDTENKGWFDAFVEEKV